MSELMESNPNNNIAINYMLCSDLLLKDMETFKHDYDAYYLKQQNVTYENAIPGGTCHLSGRNKGSACRMGKVYQEAGCIAEIQAV